jgi:hypothetical protein
MTTREFIAYLHSKDITPWTDGEKMPIVPLQAN